MPKEPKDWEETDLLDLIKGSLDENPQLEYKGPDALKNNDGNKNSVSKDVSAFANSAGGTIVYGITEKKVGHSRKPDKLQGVDSSEVSKEWVEQVINSRIQPRIDDIVIKAVQLHQTAPGKVAYVICIPQGTTAHQASDHKYYKRYNFSSVPMEHYEIMDVLNRIRHPKVIAEIGAYRRNPSQGYDARNEVDVSLSMKLRNVGERVAEKVYFECFIPQEFMGSIYLGTVGGTINTNGIPYRKLTYYYRQPDGLFPLFPRTDHEVLDGNRHYVHLKLPREREIGAKDAKIFWAVYADGAPPAKGEISIYELFFPS